MWYRASHARRLWQTEHTAGGIQEGKNERGSRGGNHLKGWMLVVPNVRGVLVPNIFGSMGCDGGPLRRCPSAEKAVLFPSAACRFAQPVGNRWWRYPRRWFMNEISRSNVFSLLSANQRLLERLEAENAQLRGRVAELMLEIQALRDALGHPQSDTQPNRCHRPSGHR